MADSKACALLFVCTFVTATGGSSSKGKCVACRVSAHWEAGTCLVALCVLVETFSLKALLRCRAPCFSFHLFQARSLVLTMGSPAGTQCNACTVCKKVPVLAWRRGGAGFTRSVVHTLVHSLHTPFPRTSTSTATPFLPRLHAHAHAASSSSSSFPKQLMASFQSPLEYLVWGFLYVLAGFGTLAVGSLVFVAFRVCLSSAHLVKEPYPARFGEMMAAEATARRQQEKAARLATTTAAAARAAAAAATAGGGDEGLSPREEGHEGFTDVELGGGGGGVIGAEEEEEERYEDAVAPALVLPRIVSAGAVAPAQ